MVGVRTERRFAGTAVSAARIQHFAAMIQDANASYWDEDFATRVWGGLVAPPALLIGLLIPPPWMPGGAPRVASIAIRVPLPGTTIVNASNDVEFGAPILEGDRLSVVEEVVSVSPEKHTRLGAGHFVQTAETYTTHNGTAVATSRNTLLRFTPAGQR
ncbi:MAG: MaoC family dehydratase N-terminal domain-containing protein [Mycobacteriaceae bacterium]|nr:MaoC family dehydratase N-terminal domain-containing protein [Mycobacteriaceae bacterium]